MDFGPTVLSSSKVINAYLLINISISIPCTFDSFFIFKPNIFVLINKNIIDDNYKNINIKKIYLDAFTQEATPGGPRSPDAQKAITESVEKGTLLINYSGHGGELGWTKERILEVGQINKWENKNNLPLFVTATCEFSRFDDPARNSAGEYAFLNKNGGAIALFSTTRLVYASPNYQLNKQFVKVKRLN